MRNKEYNYPLARA